MSQKWTSKFVLKEGTWVFVPSVDSVKQGKQIKSLIESRWTPPDYYYHLRDGGHVKAIGSHVSNAFFAHCDIKSFFGCINRSRITRALKRIAGYSLARQYANDSTVIHPTDNPSRYMLPFGFVQSPVLASLCLRQSALGSFLHKLSKRNDVKVSVYVDDIIVSSNSQETLTDVIAELNHVASISGFAMNEEKFEGPTSGITAFNIELSNANTKISSDRLDKFVSALNDATSEHQRTGILGYVHSVNEQQALLLSVG